MTTNNTVSTTEQKPEKEELGKTFIFSFYAFLFFLTLPYNIGVFIKPDYMPLDGFHVFLFLIYTIVTCGFSIVYFNDYRTQNEKITEKKQSHFINTITTFTQHAIIFTITITMFYFYASMAIDMDSHMQKTSNVIEHFSGYETFDLLFNGNNPMLMLAMLLLMLLCLSDMIKGVFILIFFLLLHSIDENVMTLLGHVFNPILECFSHSPLTMTAPIIFVVAITAIHAVMHRKDTAILTKETNIEEQSTEDSHAKIIK
jgi:hypothetical protein